MGHEKQPEGFKPLKPPINGSPDRVLNRDGQIDRTASGRKQTDDSVLWMSDPPNERDLASELQIDEIDTENAIKKRVSCHISVVDIVVHEAEDKRVTEQVGQVTDQCGYLA